MARETHYLLDESRKETAEGVARSSNRFCSQDGSPCCYEYHRLEYHLLSSLLFFCFISLFACPPPPAYRTCAGLPLLRVASCVPQLSVPLQHIWVSIHNSLSALSVRHLQPVSFQKYLFSLFCCFFCSCSWSDLCCGVLVPGTLAFHLLYPLIQCYSFFLYSREHPLVFPV